MRMTDKLCSLSLITLVKPDYDLLVLHRPKNPMESGLRRMLEGCGTDGRKSLTLTSCGIRSVPASYQTEVIVPY